MNIDPLQRHVVASDILPENLAGNKSLSEQQKIAEASRQFEAILLRQILSETQKPVITSEFTDNSTAAGIYQDFISSTLADSISKSGSFGLAKVFEAQLSPRGSAGVSPTNRQKPAGEASLPGQPQVESPKPSPAGGLHPLAAPRRENSAKNSRGQPLNRMPNSFGIPPSRGPLHAELQTVHIKKTLSVKP